MSATGTVGLMARAVQKRTPSSGDHHTSIPELTLHRRNRPTQVVHCIYTLGVAVTLQGGKHVLLGERELSYGPGQSLLTTIDLPISYHITRATAAEPYLGVMLKFDQSLLMQVASTLEKPREGKATFEPISLQRLDAPVLDALHRLLLLLDEPKLIPQLSPLIQHEILVHLLNGPHAPHLWNLIRTNGPTQKIAQAANWIRQHFAEQMRVDDVAETTNMRPTTFRPTLPIDDRHESCAVSKTTAPTRGAATYARSNMSAGSASALVGYESASQFNREYKRLFGAPPQADMRKMAV